jgi:tripartite-type tricarboxylate transporter receptor subunit TctC
MPLLRSLAAAFASLVFLPVTAMAQAKWPERPVKMVIPFAPGGPNDMVARVWTERLGQSFGQPFVIDNRGGATGLIGTEAVVRSAADGYTLLFGSSSVLAAGLAVKKTNIDPRRDLTPVARVGDLVMGLAVHPSVPVKTIEDFKDYVRKNPGKLAWGSSGVGGQAHLLIEAMRLHAGLDVLHVPYRGMAEALQDLLAGQIQVLMDSAAFGQPGVKLNYLAVLMDKRLPERPDLPTMVEAGMIPVTLTSWYGIYGPAGLPRDIVDTLNAKIAELGKDPELVAQLRGRGAVLTLNSPEETGKALADQYNANKELLTKVKIEVD